MAGAYTGNTNHEFTFTFLGSGTVGVDADLRLEVKDSGGSLVTVLEVGSDYEPGSNLLVADGVQLALSSGTAASGDSFRVDVVSRPDETGLLAAMGLNTLFAGDSASNIGVNPLLLDDPTLLASTTTGEPSDTSNLLRMVGVRDEHTLAGGTQI